MPTRYLGGPPTERASGPAPEGPNQPPVLPGAAYGGSNEGLNRLNPQSGRAENAIMETRGQTGVTRRMAIRSPSPHNWADIVAAEERRATQQCMNFPPGQALTNPQLFRAAEGAAGCKSSSQPDVIGNQNHLKRKIHDSGHLNSETSKNGTREAGRLSAEEQSIDERASDKENHQPHPTSPVSPGSSEGNSSGDGSPVNPEALYMSAGAHSDNEDEEYDALGPLNYSRTHGRNVSSQYYLDDGLDHELDPQKFCIYSPKGQQRLIFILRSLGMSVYTSASTLQDYLCRNPSIIWHLASGTTPLGGRYDTVVTGPARGLNDMLYQAICELDWPYDVINDALYVAENPERDEDTVDLALRLRKTVRYRA